MMSHLLKVQKKVNIWDKNVYKKTQLSNRFIIMAKRDEGIEIVFSFEIIPILTAFHYGSYDEKTQEA